jgi:hypothetical protein
MLQPTNVHAPNVLLCSSAACFRTHVIFRVRDAQRNQTRNYDFAFSERNGSMTPLPPFQINLTEY